MTGGDILIHTFTVISQIDKRRYSELLQELEGLENKDERGLVTTYYNKHGLREIVLTARPQFDYYQIAIRVNPSVLLNQREVIGLMKEDQFGDVCKAFDRAKVDITSVNLPDLREWDANRVDYAYEVRTPLASQYVRLFKNGDIPNYLKPNKKSESSSLYLKSKTVNVNFYDKFEQQKQRAKEGKFADLVASRDILRFEVQCKNGKLNNMKSEGKVAGKNIENFVSPDLAKEIILHYFDWIIGTGTYLKLATAQRRVDEDKSLSKQSKRNLKYALELMAQARSISRARKQFIKGISIKNTQIYIEGIQDTFNVYLAQLQALGLNPVTIPRRWKNSDLPSLREEIQNA